MAKSTKKEITMEDFLREHLKGDHSEFLKEAQNLDKEETRGKAIEVLKHSEQWLLLSINGTQSPDYSVGGFIASGNAHKLMSFLAHSIAHNHDLSMIFNLAMVGEILGNGLGATEKEDD